MLQNTNWQMVSALVGVAGVLVAIITFFYGRRTAFKTIDNLHGQIGNLKLEKSRIFEELQNEQSSRKTCRKALEIAEERINGVLRTFRKGDSDIWLREPVTKPDNYPQSMRNSIPIVLFANFKGGVGKTTTTANLLAYFEQVHGERVLAIDLDYQGSLSSMLLPEAVQQVERDSSHVIALMNGVDGDRVMANTDPVRDTIKDSRVVSCNLDFANFETQALLEWLIGERTNDIRYNLANVLQSDDVQKKFHRVLIDSPPRMTFGFVAAACASTHLFVPTILDNLSAEGVRSFIGDYNRLRGELFPHLKFAGIIGTMRRTNAENLDGAEENAVAALRELLIAEFQSHHHLMDKVFMPKKEAFSRAAGLRIAYNEDIGIRRLIDPLGDLVRERTGSAGG